MDTFYLLPFLISTAISFGVSLYCWQRRSETESMMYALVAFSQASWTLGYVFELSSPTLAGKTFWDNFQFIGASGWLIAFLMFTLECTNRWPKRASLVYGTAALPFVVFQLLAYTDRWHHLIRPQSELVPAEPFSTLVYDFTPAVWLYSLYAYGLFLICLLILLLKYIRSDRLYRAQTGLVLVGNLLPLVGTIFTLLGLIEGPYRDISPFTFAIGNIIVVWGLFRYRLFDIVPLAWDKVVENMSDAVVVVDARNRIINLNPAAREMTNLHDKAVIGQSSAEVFADWVDIVERYQNVDEARVEIEVETPIGVQCLELRIQPFYDRRHLLNGRVILIRNITPQKRLDNELKRYRDHLEDLVQERTAELDLLNRAGHALTTSLDLDEILTILLAEVRNILNVISCSVWLLDPETKELVCRQVANPQSEMVRGWRLAPGQGVAGWVAQHGESQNVTDVLQDERHFSGIDKRTGFPIRSILTVPLLRQGRILGVIQAVDGVVERFKESELLLLESLAATAAAAIENAQLFSALKETQAQLVGRERLAALGQMAATVAHELRNPLMAIRMGVDYFLRDVTADDPRQRGAALMQQNMDRVDHIIEDILFISRNPQPDFKQHSLQALIESEIDRWQDIFDEQGVDCHVKLDADLQPVYLDINQMSRVLTNLITNSLEVLSSGSEIYITLNQQNDQPMITFADNGPGMDAETLNHIFEPFFTTRTKGIGLGLSIVRQIIEQHQGTIEVWSELNAGTVFTITLPTKITG